MTFPNAMNLRAALRQLPLTSLLLETDAPFLAPQAYRGQRNEPAYVRAVADALAALTGVPAREVEHATDANACALFGLS